MGSPTGEIQVELEGDEIVVTQRGTRYLLAYRKSVDRPQLVMTRSWMGANCHRAGDKRV